MGARYGQLASEERIEIYAMQQAGRSQNAIARPGPRQRQIHHQPEDQTQSRPAGLPAKTGAPDGPPATREAQNPQDDGSGDRLRRAEVQAPVLP